MDALSDWKTLLNCDVLTAARQRVTWAFDTAPRIYVSFSAGKDSTVLLHLAAEEARRRGRRIGVLFIDLEAQYQLTIDHALTMFAMYADVIDPYWVALPIALRNAVSQFQPQWCAWEPGAEWVRQPPPTAITTPPDDWTWYTPGMEFEDFVPAFGHWYGGGRLTIAMVGIRTAESLNRWRSLVALRKSMLLNRRDTTWIGKHLYNMYPIYDWSTEDIWTYHGKTGLPYNVLYDRMHQAGLSIHQMRICQPYGDDQRKGLWLFHLIEPETWTRVVARVQGANQGALYSQESGNILGVRTVELPAGHTWESYTMLLLGSMPEPTAEHYKNKIAVFLKWYQTKGYPAGIPDDGPLDKDQPSWRRICKALLRNDYWMKALSFTPHKTAAYDRYTKIMKKRRAAWRLI